MADITRHSPKNETSYTSSTVLADCDPIDMRLMSSAIITFNTGTMANLQPYYSNLEDGTYRKLNSQDAESNVLSCTVGEGIDLHPSCFPVKWLKLLAGSGVGELLVDAKG